MTERRRKLVRGLAKLAVVAAALIAVWIVLARQWSAEIRYANAKGMRARLDREYTEMRDSKETRRVVPLEKLQPGGWWDTMYILPPGTDPRAARDRIDKGWRSRRLDAVRGGAASLVVFVKENQVVGEFELHPGYGLTPSPDTASFPPTAVVVLEWDGEKRSMSIQGQAAE